MKTKYYLIFPALLLSLVLNINATAQQCLEFKYDASGNRIRRMVNSNCIEIRDNMEEQEITNEDLIVYPNPTDGCFKILASGNDNEKMCYVLYDMNGIVLLENTFGMGETVVDMSNHMAGVYLLKIVRRDECLSKIILKR